MGPCPACGGWGTSLSDPDQPVCQTCAGSGLVMMVWKPCGRCEGSGKSPTNDKHPCASCSGEGGSLTPNAIPDTPTDVDVSAVKQAFHDLRTGSFSLDEHDADRNKALTLAVGLLHWSAVRTSEGSDPAEIIQSLNEGTLVITHEGIWHNGSDYHALIVRFPQVR